MRSLIILLIASPLLAGPAERLYQIGLSEKEAKAMEDQASSLALELGRDLDETVNSYVYALKAWDNIDATARDSLSKSDYATLWCKTANKLLLRFPGEPSAKSLDEWIDLMAHRYQLPLAQVENVADVMLTLKQQSRITFTTLMIQSKEVTRVLLDHPIKPENRKDALIQFIGYAAGVEQVDGKGSEAIKQYAAIFGPDSPDRRSLRAALRLNAEQVKRAAEGDRAAMAKIHSALAKRMGFLGY